LGFIVKKKPIIFKNWGYDKETKKIKQTEDICSMCYSDLEILKTYLYINLKFT
jgi:hypothetical protein